MNTPSNPVRTAAFACALVLEFIRSNPTATVRQFVLGLHEISSDEFKRDGVEGAGGFLAEVISTFSVLLDPKITKAITDAKPVFVPAPTYDFMFTLAANVNTGANSFPTLVSASRFLNLILSSLVAEEPNPRPRPPGAHPVNHNTNDATAKLIHAAECGRRYCCALLFAWESGPGDGRIVQGCAIHNSLDAAFEAWKNATDDALRACGIDPMDISPEPYLQEKQQ